MINTTMALMAAHAIARELVVIADLDTKGELTVALRTMHVRLIDEQINTLRAWADEARSDGR